MLKIRIFYKNGSIALEFWPSNVIEFSSVDSLGLLLVLMFFVRQNQLYQMQGIGIKEVMRENHGITKLTRKRDFSAPE
jgi:hypothetical protein